jgi:hypothetical protein
MMEFIIPFSLALILCFFTLSLTMRGFLRYLSIATMVFIAVVDVTLYYSMMEAKNATI